MPFVQPAPKPNSPWILCLLILCCFLSPALSVKRENFKTCSQSGFCSRNRAFADTVTISGSSWASPYRLDPKSIKYTSGELLATVLKTTGAGDVVRLPLSITFYESGNARVVLDEEQRRNSQIELRHVSKARKERWNGAADWAIVGGLEISKSAELSRENEDGVSKVYYGPPKSNTAVIRHAPFGIEFMRDGETHVIFNEQGFLNVEHWRPKIERSGSDANVTTEDESTWWEESFGGNTDSKPKGPESVALDITFPGYGHVFGIPEHTGPLSLKETRGGRDDTYSEPYRLYNSDVFEYELDSPMTLYGAIPFMQAHRKDSTVGVFWLNAAETWVDIVKSPSSLGKKDRKDTRTHWFSESGLLDVFVFLGPSPKDVIKTYSDLTGYTQLPQHFSVGYHQCRWNYMSSEDVLDVNQKFDRFGIPYDVIWLDLEYTDDRKYFTWDSDKFPDPISMQDQLNKRQRKLVTLIDPHIKNTNNYPVVDQLKSKGFGIKNKDGEIYDGWCWPGSSYWVDCFNPAAVEWWMSLFKHDFWKGSTPNTFIWNDMGEPSVFNGPETTMPKDNIHHGGWEHRDVHNINGLTFVNATYNALLERTKGEIRRPFVLTRSFYSGSQRLGAVWTGDNLATWGHLAASFPMLLSMSISGFPNAGADVGGFFGAPSSELLTRWYQAGAFYPFFRAHAHIDTRRREPYLIGDPYTPIITQAIRLRYQLLPAWYTAFHEASKTGIPIIQPQFYVHPTDETGFAIDDQFYVGGTGLLVKPVVTEGATNVSIYLSNAGPYYDYFDYTTYSTPGVHSMAAPLSKIPVLLQAGYIIPRRDRPRRSSELMKWDPFTLVVVLGHGGDAEGSLYLDDGHTFDYNSGAYIHRRFVFDAASSTLTSSDLSTKGKLSAKFLGLMAKVRVERVVIVGAPKEWAGMKKVAVEGDGGRGSMAELLFHPAEGRRAAWAVVRDPGLRVGADWRISFR